MNQDRKNWNRFRYWFDNQMSRGSLTLIKLLSIVTLVIVAVVAALVMLTEAGQEMGVFGSLWESFSTIINAWMPSAEDGDGSLLYLVLMAVAAISGLLITSVLIGIISSAIEEKITSLKQGNSLVMEEGHTVIIGFEPGEFTLLSQLIVAADDHPTCIVVAGDQPRDEMEEAIRGNLDIPKNVRIICRTVDIYDAASLERCALSEAKSIIIRPGNDAQIVKTLLAVTQLIDPEAERRPEICAFVSRRRHMLPAGFREKHHITMLYAGDAIAKIIARAATQPGISTAFEEMLNFEGYDLYFVSLPAAAGLTFRQLTQRMDRSVPLGISRDGRCLLNPDPDTLIGETDLLLVFAPDEDEVELLDSAPATEEKKAPKPIFAPAGRIGIIGANRRLKTILEELPEDVSEALIFGTGEKEAKKLLSTLSEPLQAKLRFLPDNVSKPEGLETVAQAVDHIILLNSDEMDEEEADFESILRILRLRELRERNDLTYNITAEMCRENNQQLVADNEGVDFVVASNISSLFLVQLAEEPRLYGVFKELLSNEGNELFIRSAAELGCTGTLSLARLRRLVMEEGYLLLGWLPAGEKEIRFDMGLEEELTLTGADRLVVLGEE